MTVGRVAVIKTKYRFHVPNERFWRSAHTCAPSEEDRRRSLQPTRTAFFKSVLLDANYKLFLETVLEAAAVISVNRWLPEPQIELLNSFRIAMLGVV